VRERVPPGVNRITIRPLREQRIVKDWRYWAAGTRLGRRPGRVVDRSPPQL